MAIPLVIARVNCGSSLTIPSSSLVSNSSSSSSISSTIFLISAVFAFTRDEYVVFSCTFSLCWSLRCYKVGKYIDKCCHIEQFQPIKIWKNPIFIEFVNILVNYCTLYINFCQTSVILFLAVTSFLSIF